MLVLTLTDIVRIVIASRSGPDRLQRGIRRQTDWLKMSKVSSQD
jgi:hypothetical protein